MDIKVKLCTFVFISAVISKAPKWARRSNIVSIVNLNMVYQIPVWKLEKFYLGDHRSKRHVLFGSKSKKYYLWWDTLHVHTKPNLYKCKKVQRSQILKFNWIISIHSGFIAFLVIWGAPGFCGCRGRWLVGWLFQRVPPTCSYLHTHAHICTHMCNTKIYICLSSVTHAKCGIHSTLCWKIGNISGSTELFAL